MPLTIDKPTTLYSVNDAAKVLGVSRVTLWKAIRAGKLPVIRYAKWHFITHQDLVAWREAHYREDMARRKGKQRKAKATKRET